MPKRGATPAPQEACLSQAPVPVIGSAFSFEERELQKEAYMRLAKGNIRYSVQIHRPFPRGKPPRRATKTPEEARPVRYKRAPVGMA